MRKDILLTLFCISMQVFGFAQEPNIFCSKYKHATSANRLLIEDLRSDSLDIQHTIIDLDMSEITSYQISGTAELMCESQVPGLASITIDFEGLSVDSVTGEKVTNYVHQDSILRVYFDQPLSNEEAVAIKVYYSGNPMQDASGWGGFYFSGAFSWNLGVGFADDPHSYGRVWFPCFDNFIERSTFDFSITVQDDKRAACNGLLTSVEPNGNGTTTYQWELNQPIPSYLACVAVGPYITVDSEVNAANGLLPIQVHGRKSDSVNIIESFQHLDEAILAFEQVYGEYRFDKVGYSLVPFNSGAMEHATNITYPIYATNGSLSQEDLMAHELAHMWWGDNVTCQTDGDMWINEGWASFSEYLFREHVYGRDSYEKAMLEDLRYMLQFGHHFEDDYRAVSGQPHDLVYSDHVYKKGALVAHNLRGYMGDDAFSDAIHKLMDQHEFSDISSDTLEKYFGQYSGQDLSTFFRDWVYSGGYNLVVLDSFEYEQNGSTFSIKLELQQKLKGREAMHDDVPVFYTIYNDQWQRESGVITMSGYRMNLDIESSIEPSHIQLYAHNELAQARTMDKLLIKETGSHDLKNMFWDVDVSQVEDSAFVFFEHFWSEPDPVKAINEKPYRLSNYHYWKVSGLDVDKVSLSGEFIYDGRLGGNTGYIDMDLVSGQEDSLVLLYRRSSKDDWDEYEDYVKDVLGQSDNGWGRIKLNRIIEGEYTLANIDQTILSAKESDNRIEVLVYPNPSNNEVTFHLDESLNLTSTIIEIYNMEGKNVYSHSATEYINRIDVSSLSVGVYSFRVIDHDSLIYTGQFVLN